MEAVGYITTIIVVCLLCGGAIGLLSHLFRSRRKLPKLAGTVIPEIGQGLDVSKRFDIVYSGGDFNAHFVERLQAVRIVGYVGHEDDHSVSKMYMRGRWLVVEFEDARRAYLMPNSIVSLVESVSS